MSNRNQFRLVQEEDYSERIIADGESIVEVLETAAEKAGRGDLWEALDDL